MRRFDILVANLLGLVAQTHFERLGCGFNGHRIGAILRLDKPLIVFDRELGVDRQPDRAAIRSAVALPRQTNGELDPLVAARTRGNVLFILLGSQNLIEQGFQLNLAPGPARLDVGQHLLQVADTGGQRLHLAESLVHQFQPLADQLERIAEALLQRRVQLLVHRLAHLFQLAGVVGLYRAEARFDRYAQLLEALFVALRQARQLLGKRFKLLPLQGTELSDLRRQGLGQPIQRLRLLLAVAASSVCRFLAPACQFLPQLALQALESAFQSAKTRFQRIVLAPGSLQQEKLQRQNNQPDRGQPVQQKLTHAFPSKVEIV